MSSWAFDPEVLIIEVESHPLLYSKSLPEYANKIMKNNAWEDITKKLSEDWDSLTNENKNSRCKDVQAKWKHLRDNFRREYQAQKDVTSGTGAKKRKKYRYYDQLLFLIPFVKDAKTSGNYSTQNTQVQSTPNVEDAPAAAPSVQSTPNDADSPAAGPSTARNKKKKTSFEEAVLKAIGNENMSMDEDKTFCLSLVQSLQKMDDDNKMLAKIEILNVIRTYSNRTRNTYISNPSEPNQSPYIRPNIGIEQQPSQSRTTFINQAPHQQYSQLTFTQACDMYQQPLQSHPTPSLYQFSSVNLVPQSKMIKILENRQYRPANSTANSSRPNSAQSFFTTYDPNICPSPSSSTMAQSPFNNISSPEECNLSRDDC